MTFKTFEKNLMRELREFPVNFTLEKITGNGLKLRLKGDSVTITENKIKTMDIGLINFLKQKVRGFYEN